MSKQEQKLRQFGHNQEDQQIRIGTSFALPTKDQKIDQFNPGVRVQVGLARFEQKFFSRKQRDFINKRKEIIFLAQNWFIGSSYYRQQWNQLFPYIEEATCTSIVVQFDLCEDIIKDFSRPRFVNLKQLTLVYNTIKNLQALNFINAKCLQTLNLQGNYITTTKTLNKSLFQCLVHFDLSKNFIKKMEVINFKSKNTKFFFDFLIHQRDRQIQDISFYAKMQIKKPTESLKSALNSFSGVKYSYAIVQKNICKAMKRKFMEGPNDL